MECDRFVNASNEVVATTKQKDCKVSTANETERIEWDGQTEWESKKKGKKRKIERETEGCWLASFQFGSASDCVSLSLSHLFSLPPLQGRLCIGLFQSLPLPPPLSFSSFLAGFISNPGTLFLFFFSSILLSSSGTGRAPAPRSRPVPVRSETFVYSISRLTSVAA